MSELPPKARLRRATILDLLHEWDPIGAGQGEEALSEEDDRVHKIDALIQHKRPEEEIFAYLSKIEMRILDITENLKNTEKTESIAKKLFEMEEQ